MVDDRNAKYHLSLPYDTDGRWMELLWIGLGVLTARVGLQKRTALNDPQQTPGPDPVLRLSTTELQTLLSVLEDRFEAVQQDISRVRAALNGAAGQKATSG